MTVEIDLTGYTTIVTGGGRGIGREIADAFARAGSDVVVAARTESEIRRTAEAVAEYGVEAEAVPTDVSDVEQAEALVEHTTRTLGDPDVLVNNAGVNLAERIADQSIEDVETMNDVNLTGVFALSRAFADAVPPDTDRASIVNLSSIYARAGVPGKAAYSATKAGVYGLTRSLAVELAPRGITVNSVSPGRIEVDRIESVMECEDFRTDLIPLGRLGDPKDVAYCCLFLASEFARYVTGVDVPIDGGTHATTGPYNTGT